MFPFPSALLTVSSGPVIDGTQGSANAGILAAAYVTFSGSTPTIVAQKNVASVTRLSAGIYRITFTSALANTNYGLIGGGRWVDSSTGNTPIVTANRNTSVGANYSTTTLDLGTINSQGSGSDPASFGIVVFDPAAVGSDYLAACSVTVSGTTPTVQRQTNVSSSPRQTTGVYTPTFTSALPNSDYSIFGSSRFEDFNGYAFPFFGRNRNTTVPTNRQTTGLIDLDVGTQAKSGTTRSQFEPGRFSMLVRNSDVAPRGTLAAARFSVSGGVCTLIRSWNVSSVTYQAAGLYRVNFTNPLVDTDYVLMGSGRWTADTNDDAPVVGMNCDTTNSRGVHSVNAVDVVCRAWGLSPLVFDCDYVDVWVVKPALM